MGILIYIGMQKRIFYCTNVQHGADILIIQTMFLKCIKAEKGMA